MQVLSLKAQVFMVEHLLHCEGEYTGVVKQKFAEMCPKSHMPHHNTVHQLINKFRETDQL